MKRQLSILVEEDSIVKLQEMAGSKRKVGQFVSGLADWAWENRSILKRTPLEELELRDGYRVKQIEMLHRRLTVLEERMESLGGKD